jgi:hypothetical protein
MGAEKEEDANLTVASQQMQGINLKVKFCKEIVFVVMAI